MINRIYNTVKFFTNNQVQGNVKPTEYNVALYNRLLEIYEGYFFELNRNLNRENRGLITGTHGDIPQKLRERISHYLSDPTEIQRVGAVDDYSFPLPDDCRYIDSIYVKGGNTLVTLAKNSLDYHNTIRYKHTAPTLKYPIVLKTSTNLSVSPDSIEYIIMYYLRNPKVPNWTFIKDPSSVNDVELYNPSDPLFQDVDIHISEENNLTLLVLKSFGINLKEEELVQVAASEEMKNFQQENSI